MLLAEALCLLIPVGSSPQPNPTWASQLSISPQMAQAKGPKKTEKERQRNKQCMHACMHVCVCERESVKLKISHRDGISGWSYCAFCLASGSKTGIQSIQRFLCVNVCALKSLSSPCQYFISCFLIYHTPGLLPTHVDFFFLSLSLSSVDINTQYVTAGCAPNAPSVLISTKCESVILL